MSTTSALRQRRHRRHRAGDHSLCNAHFCRSAGTIGSPSHHTPVPRTFGGPQVLYRFFDADDELLYIGVTADISDRVRRHRSEKPWWTDVARMTLEHHPDRQSVELAERLAIAAEAPRWNVMHARPARPAPRVTDVERSTLRVTYGDTQIVWESAEPIEVLTQSTLAILRGINNG